MRNDEITFFAETNFRNDRKRFGIKKDDRRRHIYVIGKTGMGKSVLLENMAISDILAGRGVGFVDPHGESAERMLDFVPEHRIDDVIYFNPADIRNPIAFNPVEQVSHEHRHLVASGLMGVFKKIWPDVWSARMEYILNNTILALLETPGSNLLGVMKMFSDKNYRKEVIKHVTDPVIKSFWVDEFAKFEQRYAVEATAAIQNKIGQFLSATIIRNIVGQEHSAFDMRTAMDEKKIIIMDLSKGRIGEDNSKLLGGLLVAKIQLAAMSRVDIPERDRNDFYLYVDEFQNFATESFANILSEARKYRLNLTLANQYIAQLTEMIEGGRNTKVRDSVFGNVGTLMSFRIGAEDAEFLEKEFEPAFTANDVVNLPKYNIYLKMMIDGVASQAFSATTLAPHAMPERSFKEEIISRSREQYSSNRDDVERSVAQWQELPTVGTSKKTGSSEPDFMAKPHVVPAASGQSVGEGKVFETNQGQKLYEAVCWEGGEKVLVPFKPDGIRPIFCKNHIHKLSELNEQSKVPSPISLSQATSGTPKKEGKKGTGRNRKKRSRNGNQKPDVDLNKLRKMVTETRIN